jgi:hypothetical protein
MTTTSATTTLIPSSDDANQAMAGPYRRANRPVLTSPAGPGLRSRRHPSSFRPDSHQPRVAGSETARASAATWDPTVSRKPVPLEDALAQTRHYIDSSAGPDRAQDIARLSAQVAQTADLVDFLTKAQGRLNRARTAAGEARDDSTGIASSVRREQDRLQRAEDAWRDAMAAQQSRQAWLDEHPETLVHLDELSARARRRPAVSHAKRTPRRSRPRV